MKWLLAVLGTLLFMAVVLAAGWLLPAPEAAQGKPLLSYDQFIAISLTAVTVVLAVIALLMAYLAFEGKTQIIEKAREIAEQEIKAYQPQLLRELREEAKDHMMQYFASQDAAVRNFMAEKEQTAGTGSATPADVQELKS